ncbi:hypothetical protein [Achromobacter aloeverae]
MPTFPLKKHSTEAIQEAIANALTELCGVKMEARVDSLDYGKGSQWSDSVGITLTVNAKPDLSKVPF